LKFGKNNEPWDSEEDRRLLQFKETIVST
jgi:hypothetical protein